MTHDNNGIKAHNLLLVDDDPYILEGIGSGLEFNGFQVTRASSGEEAVDLLKTTVFDLVITDLVMETTDGIQVLKKAKDLYPEIQVIILTGYGDLDSAIRALRHQADDFLLKPCESQEMIFRVKNCLEKQEMSRKIRIYQKILPMCCVCKKIRDDSGRKPGSGDWVTIEHYFHEKVDLDVTSSYCPECAQIAMADFKNKAGSGKQSSPNGKSTE
jgi:YesN/AraC family two-component response regulator